LEQENDWDSLVLPPGHREMVQAMVETHSRGSQDTQSASLTQYGNISMDLVKGKGKSKMIHTMSPPTITDKMSNRQGMHYSPSWSTGSWQDVHCW
jgi:hypothetical protein